MQNARNTTKQLSTPAWQRCRTDILSAAAHRPSKIGGGGAHDLSSAAAQGSILNHLKPLSCYNTVMAYAWNISL